MKSQLLIVILSALSIVSYSRAPINKGQLTDYNRTNIINASDSIIFDLSQAIITFNSVEVPVYILSDDTINALDFSLQYNHTTLSFDSVENHTNYLQAFSYYNSSDSTIRFTSNSLQRYANDSILVSIRFTLLAGQINSSDLFSLYAYLNGDPCSYRLIDPLPTKIGMVNEMNKIKIYPNPAQSIINVEFNDEFSFEIINNSGQRIYGPVSDNYSNKVNISFLEAGYYIVNIYDGTNNYRRTFIKED